MTRCYLDPSSWTEPEVRLSPEETHHVSRVLRKEPGSALEVFDGEGRHGTGRFQRMDGKQAVIHLSNIQRDSAPAVFRVLGQALLKGEKADLLVQKAVELGMDRMAWFEAHRSVVRLPSSRRAHRLARWKKVAIQAAKQCGKNRIPEMVFFESVSAFCQNRIPGEACFFCSLNPRSRPAREVFRSTLNRSVSRVCVSVGPEGDFTPEEEKTFVRSGAKRISLGAQVLRAETAALYVMAVLAYEWEGRVPLRFPFVAER